MLLYISNATAYSIYDRLFRSGKIKYGYQSQKFNSNIISGLGKQEAVVSLSCLPYEDIPANRVDETIDGIRYVAVKNNVGRLHPVYNLLQLFTEGAKIIRSQKPSCILCDAFSTSPCLITQALGRVFHIPTVGIITDLPGMMGENADAISGAMGRMQNFDAFILLTEQMNPIVNPTGKPHIVMEGLCAQKLPEQQPKNEKDIILYTGSLWKELAGIEYLVEGFRKAAIPNAELHFYGTGELEPWLAAIHREDPSVRYMGCVTNEEIVRIQCQAALLVNPRPSGNDFCKYSFPSKTIEYMASGTPVLLTKLPGIPKEYFDYTYTIDPETPEGVCKALTEIFQSSRAQRNAFGSRARDFVATQKSCDAQCRRILEFVNTLVKFH